MRKSIAVVAGMILAVLAMAGTASAAPHPVRPNPHSASITTQYNQVCDTALLCLRDPSDGGAGTVVKMTAINNGTKSENWVYAQDGSFCNTNGGWVEPGCGLPSFLVDRYQGHAVILLTQEVSGNCIKFSLATQENGVMGTCFLNSTLLINGSCNSSNYCYYVSINASEDSGQINWMCGGITGNPPYAGVGCPHETWGLFAPN